MYGTLRPELNSNWLALEPYATRHEAAILPGFRLYADGVPYIGIGGHRDIVRGDLVTIRSRDYEAALADLDGLEGYSPPHLTMYIRAGVGAWVGRARGPRGVTAWAYLGGPRFSFHRSAQVRGGDYVAHVHRRREAYIRARKDNQAVSA